MTIYYANHMGLLFITLLFLFLRFVLFALDIVI